MHMHAEGEKPRATKRHRTHRPDFIISEYNLMDVSDIFYVFSARGGGSGSPRRQEGEVRFSTANPRRWVSRRERGRGAGRVSAANCVKGGGSKLFFFGAEMSSKIIFREEKQHKHKLFGPDFPRTFLTLTPECPGVKKFLPTTGAAGKTHFLVRTSTIFGADVHDPKGC